MASKDAILDIINSKLDRQQIREQHWTGTFHDYLAMVAENPRIARNAFQRIYDMIMHYGVERYSWMKDDYVRYTFFSDPFSGGADAVYGLDGALMSPVSSVES